MIRRFFRIFVSFCVSFGILCLLFAYYLQTQGRLGDAVELFRQVTGEPGIRLVAWAEDIYFENRYRFHVFFADRSKKNENSIESYSVISSNTKNNVVNTSQPSSIPLSPFVPTPSEQLTWREYRHPDQTSSGIYTAQLFINPELPNEPIYLAWVDPREFVFHWVPGTTEPSDETREKIKGLSRAALVPAEEQDRLVAAFNGGYLSKHGHFGAMFDGVTVLPARTGYATAVITQDGKLRLGEWGRDILATDTDTKTFRQNLKLIVDKGEQREDAAKRAWGGIRGVVTKNDPLQGEHESHTWRSGIGVTQEGALIFAAGDFMDGALLAKALEMAGAERAMQLDVNAAYFCVFLFYEKQADGTWNILPLGDKMQPYPGQFVTRRSQKDFVYITKRP